MIPRQRRSVLWTALGVSTLVAVASAPALAAGGFDSTTEALLRNLHRKLLVIAVTLAVLVEAALFYAAVRFHGNPDPKPTVENRRLEIAWTIGVAVVLLFVGTSSYLVLADPAVSNAPDALSSEPGEVRVEIVGQNWFWSFSYPQENVTTRNTLVLPVDRPIHFTVTSRDVIHSVHVPGLGLKQDAIPGQRNALETRLTDTGTYRLYCAEFCGTGHSKMLATVRVVSQDEYGRWLSQQRRRPASQNRTANATSG